MSNLYVINERATVATCGDCPLCKDSACSFAGVRVAVCPSDPPPLRCPLRVGGHTYQLRIDIALERGVKRVLPTQACEHEEET